MKFKLQILIATVFVLAVYIPTARAQANLTFSGGNNTPLSITLQQSVSYTINNSNCAPFGYGPYFVFQGVGNVGGPEVTGTINYSINGGTPQSITGTASGVNQNNVTANDFWVYGSSEPGVANGNTVVLNAGTITTTNNVAAAPPANGSYTTFIVNYAGTICSTNGVSTPTAASVSISGRVFAGSSKRGLVNAFVYLTDAKGNTRAARTNSFGYYHFEDISAGQTVTLTVVSKRFQFAPQILNLNEEVTQLNFVAEN